MSFVFDDYSFKKTIIKCTLSVLCLDVHVFTSSHSGWDY